MRRGWLIVFAVMSGAVGCTPYIIKPDVVGPHGENLIELGCSTPDECMAFARQTCGGDFDVVTNNGTAPNTQTSGAADIMLVRCANARPPGALPDAGT